MHCVPCVPEQHHGAPLALVALFRFAADRWMEGVFAVEVRWALPHLPQLERLPGMRRHVQEAVLSLLPSSVLFSTFSIQVLHLLSQ